MAQNIPGSSSVNLVQNVGGRPVQGVLGQNPLVGSKGEAPVGGLEDEVPQKLKQFEFLYAFSPNFKLFSPTPNSGGRVTPSPKVYAAARKT